MSGPTQALRQIAIATPLGPDVLLVRRCSFREEISRLFRIDLHLVSKKNDILFDDIIGKNVTVRLELEDQTRYFNGFVSRFVQTRTERSYSVYQATVVPWLWFLTRTSDCRIFQQSMEEPPDEMTVPGIIKKVFKDFGFENFVSDDGLSESYREWEFCVQYRETAFNFVSRLMEQEGIGYYFKHEDGKHTLMLTDSINAHTPCEHYENVPYHPHQQGAQDKEAVTDWTVEKEVQPGVFAHNDFDFENPRQVKQNALVTQSAIDRAHDLANFQIYDYPGEFEEHGEGEGLAKLRIQELQVRHESLHGQATALGLCAGYIFNLENHPRDDQNREYLITSTAYEIDAGEFETSRGGAGKEKWSCRFTAIPSDQPFRPARITPKPLIQGVQTALVVGPSGEEIHTDAKARVKVQFHWDRYGKYDENSSCWIRVSQPWAGKGWGSQATPRIDQEVIVEFLEGDPDRPIITGRVYNGDQTPPYPQSGEATMTTLKSNSVGGGGFNELRFDDKQGSEQVFLHASKNLDARITNDSMEWIGNDQHLVVKNDKFDHVENNRNEKVDNDHKEEIGGARHLKVTGLEAKEVGGTLSLKVTGDVAESFQGKHSEETTGDFYLKATGALVIESSTGVTLKCGGNNVVIDSTGVTVKGSMVVVDGSMVKVASGPGSPAGTGSAGSLESPVTPEAAIEAAVADPGQAAENSAQNAQIRGAAVGATQAGELGSNLADSAGEESAVDEKTSWISIELKDEDGHPMPGERYLVKLPDGTFRNGSLDGEGKARIAGIKPGTCEVSYPDIDGDEWRPA